MPMTSAELQELRIRRDAAGKEYTRLNNEFLEEASKLVDIQEREEEDEPSKAALRMRKMRKNCGRADRYWTNRICAGVDNKQLLNAILSDYEGRYKQTAFDMIEAARIKIVERFADTVAVYPERALVLVTQPAM